ncbi:UNVERIFIED_CONTAM: hypothetical protein K2H54_039210 [Gekko kuhli]
MGGGGGGSQQEQKRLLGSTRVAAGLTAQSKATLAHTHGSGGPAASTGSGGAGPGSCGGNQGGPGPPIGCGERSDRPTTAVEDPQGRSAALEKEALCHPPAKPGHLLGPATTAELTGERKKEQMGKEEQDRVKQRREEDTNGDIYPFKFKCGTCTHPCKPMHVCEYL